MVLEQAQGASLAVEDTRACRHHWIIEPANGRHSRGKCRNCHEERTFENSIYESHEPDSNE